MNTKNSQLWEIAMPNFQLLLIHFIQYHIVECNQIGAHWRIYRARRQFSGILLLRICIILYVVNNINTPFSTSSCSGSCCSITLSEWKKDFFYAITRAEKTPVKKYFN